jgi:hypothetical protein
MKVFLFLLLLIEGSGSGSIQHNDGTRSGRPKSIEIVMIRVQNTSAADCGQRLKDSVRSIHTGLHWLSYVIIKFLNLNRAPQ